MEWFNPFCSGPAIDTHLNFSSCFQSTTLAFIPVAVLLLFGLRELPSLLKSQHVEKGGVGALRLKLVLAALLVIVQVVQIGVTVLNSKHFLSIPGHYFQLATLFAFGFAFYLHKISHSVLEHSSTSLLFFWLTTLATLLVSLRSVFAAKVNTDLALISLTILISKLSLVVAVFGLELLGPDGWDNQTWRDWLPLVKSEGKIKLGDDESEGKEKEQPECPRNRANIFQILTFSWLTPMMKAGKSAYLTEEDLWKLPPTDTAEALGTTLEFQWLKRKKAGLALDKKPSLLAAIFAAYGTPFMSAAVYKFLQDCLSFTQPQLLRKLLIFVGTYSTDSPEPAYKGYVIAGAMFVTAITQTLLLHCYFDRVFATGMRVRAGLVSLVFKKSVVLSNDERAGRTTGDIVNLMATDSTRIQDTCTYAQILWSGAFQITLAFISLYQLLGWTMLVGVAVMILSMPLTAAIARYQTKLQRQQMKNKDSRTRMMSEILNNVRSIKLYAWENSFSQRLFEIRNNKELVMLRKMGFLSASSNFLWSFTPFAVAFSSFALFSTVSGKPLTSEIVFPAITLFSLLSFPLAVLPIVFSSLVEAYVSLDRLRDFLGGKELQEGAVSIEETKREMVKGDELVTVVHGDFSWSSTAIESTLVDINLSVKKGELLAVVGRVGSGKSSLLSAILGEMSKVDGNVTVRGTIAYCSQSPWIMNGTVRDNITFGYVFDQEFYDLVIESCALKEDFLVFPDGDRTEVGEKGISMSGGTKARISLARAVYARADIYLLDDPLSAVDAHSARHLFDRVIGPNGLLASKARLLCTNSIPFVQQADELVLLRKGCIIERGTYESAMSCDTELSRLLTEFGHNGSEGSDSDESTVVEKESLAAKLEEEQVSATLRNRASQGLMKRADLIPVDVQKRETLLALKRSTRPKETREQGSVKSSIYKNFIKANSYLGVFFYLSTIVLQQILTISTNLWLKYWATNNEAGGNQDVTFYLTVYAAFGIGASLVFLANGLILYSFCVIRSAKTMHDSMFHAVMKSPMLFFETTPIGTILNRFSRDIYVIDEILARVFGGFFRTMAGVIGMVVVIVSVAPSFMFVVIPLMFVYKSIQGYYLATSRELKRLDATTKSPIFSSFQETLGGVSTIRAYRQSKRFIAENEARVDRNQEAYFPSINCNRWLAIRLEFLGSIIILSTAVLAVFTLVTTTRGTIDAGLVGLILSYALSTTQTLNWIVRSATEVETNIVSVERVQEYIELKPEAPSEIKATEPDASWPSSGSLSFQNVSARYRPNLDLVLKGVNFEIKGGEKVGVCGRTGAGKSSLTMALYRIVEVESGKVIIDGIDVASIGLHSLRSKLSIIPQDSQCFEGTLRENIDPTGIASDTELWKALESCKLKDHVLSMEGTLDAHIDEGGSNLSAGQRQLMCLGRALLRRSKILVLDEATAAVDPESDKEIQAVIRREFASCTIFVIAHRLNTIMDCDKIIVMDKGQVAEFDSPMKLLEDRNSIFYSLANEAGLVRGSASGSGTPRNGSMTPRNGSMTPKPKY